MRWSAAACDRRSVTRWTPRSARSADELARPAMRLATPPATTVPLTLATARTEIADFLSALIEVYIVLIVAYVLTQLVFSFGVRPPYSKTLDLVLGFLRDVSEPYLRLFRRVLPRFGAFDFSPIIAIFVLE